MSSRRFSLVAVVAGGALLVMSLWLLVDNQSVDISASDYGDGGRPAGTVGCTIAPYDAGFNGNDEPPGGEHRAAYADEVAADCYAVSMQRFHWALATGLVGVVMVAVATWFGRRSSHRAA